MINNNLKITTLNINGDCLNKIEDIIINNFNLNNNTFNNNFNNNNKNNYNTKNNILILIDVRIYNQQIDDLNKIINRISKGSLQIIATSTFKKIENNNSEEIEKIINTNNNPKINNLELIESNGYSTTAKSGIVIIGSNEIAALLIQKEEIETGRLVKIKIKLEIELEIFAIYAPTNNSAKKLFDKIKINNNSIVAGDFNRCINNGMQRNRNNIRYDRELWTWIEENGMINPIEFSEKDFTFISANGEQISTIDYILIHEDLLQWFRNGGIEKWKLMLYYDHNPVTLILGDLVKIENNKQTEMNVNLKYHSINEWKEWGTETLEKLKEKGILKEMKEVKEDLNEINKVLKKYEEECNHNAIEKFGRIKSSGGSPFKTQEIKLRNKKINKINKIIIDWKIKNQGEINERIMKLSEEFNLITPQELGGKMVFSKADWKREILTIRKDLFREIKELINEKKESNKQKFYNELAQDFRINQARFYSKLRKIKSKTFQISIVMNKEKKVSSEKDFVMKETKEYFQEQATRKEINYDEDLFKEKWFNREIYNENKKNNVWIDLFKEFTDEEIQELIDSAGNNKAPGDDKIANEFPKYTFSNETIIFFRKLVNTIINSKDMHQDWKNGVIFPLPKEGNLAELNNIRPITLLSYPWKLFMRGLCQRFNRILNSTNTISIAQAGFRSNHSTIEMTTTLVAAIDNAKRYEKEMYSTFADISKAYDSVPHQAIWRQLERIGLNTNQIKLMENLYKNNTTQIITKYGLTEKFSYENGVRQGCPLSPVLFIIFFDPIIDYLEKRKEKDGFKFENNKIKNGPKEVNDDFWISVLGFADDLALIASSIFGAQWQIKQLEDFLTSFGMKLNVKKTKLMTVNVKELEDDVCVYNIPIEWIKKNAFKYLGIWINSDLDWLEHRNYVIAKIQTVINLIEKKVILTTQQKIEILNSTASAMVSYGSISHGLTEETLEQIDIMIRKSIKRSIRTHGSLPNSVIHGNKKSGGLGVVSVKDYTTSMRIADAHALLNQDGLAATAIIKSITDASTIIRSDEESEKPTFSTNLLMIPATRKIIINSNTISNTITNSLKKSKAKISTRFNAGYETSSPFKPVDFEKCLLVPMSQEYNLDWKMKISNQTVGYNKEFNVAPMSLAILRKFRRNGISNLEDFTNLETGKIYIRAIKGMRMHHETIQAIATGIINLRNQEEHYEMNKELIDWERIKFQNSKPIIVKNKYDGLEITKEEPTIGNGVPRIDSMKKLKEIKKMINVFTDGSYNPTTNKAGFGIHFEGIEDLDVAWRLAGEQDNFRAELSAILNSINMLPNESDFMVAKKKKNLKENMNVILNNNKRTKARIFTDSTSSIYTIRNLLNKNSTKRKLANLPGFSLANAIIQQAKKKDYGIEIVYVKAHIGIAGNEIVDRLAKLGSEKDYFSQGHSEFHTKSCLILDKNISEGNVRKKIWQKLMIEKNEKCNSIITNNLEIRNESFLFLEKMNWTQNHVFNFLVKARANVLPTFEILAKRNKKVIEEQFSNQLDKPNNHCIKCNEIEDLEHIICKCKNYDEIRRKNDEVLVEEIQKRCKKEKIWINENQIKNIQFKNEKMRRLGFINPEIKKKLESIGATEKLIKDIINEIHNQNINSSYEIWIKRCNGLENTQHPNKWYREEGIKKMKEKSILNQLNRTETEEINEDTPVLEEIDKNNEEEIEVEETDEQLENFNPDNG
ncbi:hypothetical protein J4216_04930 [Candidatus Woesearchaeota archaeon]|nr:hypothetical protein [Candidatus Woesearchaeota archaeon]